MTLEVFILVTGAELKACLLVFSHVWKRDSDGEMDEPVKFLKLYLHVASKYFEVKIYNCVTDKTVHVSSCSE